MSKPYKTRAGLIPMVVAISVGFLFSFAWIGIAIWMMTRRTADVLIWGGLITLSTLVYGTYLMLITGKMLREARYKYSLELTESEAVLSVIDPQNRVRSTRMVLLDDVKYGEYYPYPDTASVILHAPYADLELPLWSFGEQRQDAIDFLEGRGVRIVNVLSDDPISQPE